MTVRLATTVRNIEKNVSDTYDSIPDYVKDNISQWAFDTTKVFSFFINCFI